MKSTPSGLVPRSGYADPRTPHGMALGEMSRAAGGFFLLHEVGWLRRGIRWHFPGVLSPFWRLYHNPRGGWRIVHEGAVWPLAADEVLLIPDGTVFDCEGEAGVPHLWFHFSLASPLRRLPARPIAQRLTPALRALTAQLIRHYEATEETEATAETAAVFHTAAALLHAALAGLGTSVLTTYPEKLAALLAVIEREPLADLTNAALARRVALSEGAFIRWFRAGVGATPAVYVQRSRMKAAAQALLMTPQSIDEVAAATGFTNRHHFSRVFRSHFHTSPAAYRRTGVRSGPTGAQPGVVPSRA